MFFAFCRDQKGKPPTTALLLPAATPLSFGDYKVDVRICSLLFVWCYGIVESIVFVTLMWTMTNQFEDEENWIFGLAVLASVGALAKWCCLFAPLHGSMGALSFYFEILEVAQEKTDLKQLYYRGQWTELSDIITFKIKDIQIACKAVFVEFPYHSASSLYVHFDCVFTILLGWKTGWYCMFFFVD